MRGRDRSRHQGIHAPEARAFRGDLQRVDDLDGRGGVGHLERQQTAESTEPLPGPEMSRRGFQAGVVDGFDPGMFLEKAREVHGGGVLLPDVQCQGLQTPLEQETGVHVEIRTEVGLSTRDA